MAKTQSNSTVFSRRSSSGRLSRILRRVLPSVIPGETVAEIAREAVRRKVLFEQAHDGILIFDAERKIIEANASFAEMLGYTLDEVVKLRPWDWDVTCPNEESFLEAWPAIPSTSGLIETQFRRNNGEIIDVDISYTPADLDGERHLYCVCRDVTARKNIQRSLKDSQERFRRVLANIPDVVVLYDRGLRIRYINDATRAITGKNPIEFIGLRDDQIFPPEVCDVYLPTLKDALESKLIRKLETDLQLPGGNLYALRLTCVPLLDQHGEVREILGITHDFTERKKAELSLRKSEVQYRELIEQAADGIFISDSDGKFVLANSRCCELLGYAREELLGMNGEDTYLEEETDVTARRMSQLISGSDLRYERMLKRKDGSVFPAEVSVKMLDSGSMQVIFHDITERHRQDRKIARLSRIHAVLSGINAAITRNRDRQALLRETCRIAVADGNFKMAWIGRNDARAGKMHMLAHCGLPFELSAENAEAGHLVDLMPDGPARFALQEERPVYDNDIEHSQYLSKLRRIAIRHGAKSVMALPLTVEGSIYGLLVLYAPERNFFDDEEVKLLKELAGDISFALELISKEEKVDYLAYYDPLTGLPNRSLFFDAFKRQLSAAERDEQKVVLQVWDIDRFRMINKTYGRDGADKLIGLIAERIRASTDEQDTIARIGPDSFVIAKSGEWQAAETAHALEEIYEGVFGTPFALDEENLRISATSGVAMFPGDGREPHALVTNAEAALQDAELRNVRRLFYSPAMNERVADSMRLENRLRQALKQDEIVMWYQPKLDVQRRELTGFEALMRWQDGRSGDMVQPSTFIPIMEQTGLILEAGQHAMAKVAADCKDWAAVDVSVVCVAVNVSLMQLEEDDFVPSVIEAQKVAREYGCDLELELTETVVMDNLDTIVSKLRALRELGILIAVDDFGTGYSSLAYISRLPIHALKIDRSFVFGMTQDQNSLTIVKSIVSLAHSLGLKVIAEGVESAEQAKLLGKLKCDEMQGYYLSPAVPPADVPELVRKFAGAR